MAHSNEMGAIFPDSWSKETDGMEKNVNALVYR